ncbi:hypothetical protein PQR15_16050 [Streptomyces lydicus]|nr:hypothetical protein [Streptomyces lydicus]
MDVTSPACSRDQLGQGTGTVRPADSAGRVYGSFRVVNTSGAACSVEGGGTVGVVAQGSTNPDRIHVVDHTSGDEATGLPDPATTPDKLVLKPGEAYEVQFAWIPESGGGTTGCVSPGPSPTPDPTKDPGQSPDAGATTAGDGGGGGGQAGGDEGSAGGGGAAPGGSFSATHRRPVSPPRRTPRSPTPARARSTARRPWRRSDAGAGGRCGAPGPVRCDRPAGRFEGAGAGVVTRGAVERLPGDGCGSAPEGAVRSRRAGPVPLRACTGSC